MSERPRKIEITAPVTITVDGSEITAQDGELLIDACERNGTYIPRFCYHPRMSPVGMCRMCLVEVDTGRGPALQPSCMLPVTPNMVVETTNERVAKVQDGVLEYLLANHPLDCPVCDKGGECPLQDQTMAYGPGESRWVEEKRHYVKPIPISETVYLDRERCILCDRCTRFADEVAGDPLIHFMDRGSNTQVNTFPGEPFASYFSGNTVQICPVGALTAKPYRFKARPWDLEEVESTCTTCSVGCRVAVQSSRNTVLRYQGVDSDPVNWSWLCDKGRFGFESLNSEERLGEPQMRNGDGSLAPARWSDALEAAASALRAANPASIAVLGGSRLTNEAQYAWARLAKGVLGTDNVDAQLGDGLPGQVVASLPSATIDDVCSPGTTILYLGPDPKEELPVLFLRLKHAAQNDGVRIVEVGPTRTGLSRYASQSLQHRPGEMAKVVDALLSGEVADGVAGVPADALSAASELVRSAGDELRVVVGRTNLAEAAGPTVDAAFAVRDAVDGARFLIALRRSNVRGAIEAGLAPGMLPGRMSLTEGATVWGGVWGATPATEGMDAHGILSAAAAGKIDVLVLLGADPLVDFADRSLARRAVAGARTVISSDCFLTASSRQADVVFAASGFTETEGTTTNIEGRVTTLHQKVTPPGTARADWMIALELAARLGSDTGLSTSQELWAELVEHSPVHEVASAEVLADTDNVDGVVLAADPVPFPTPERTHVSPKGAYEWRLVMNRTLYDEGTGISQCPSSAALAPEAVVQLSSADATPVGITSGARVTVSSAHGAVTLPAQLDDSLPKGTAVLRHNLAGVDVGLLIDANDVVCDIRVEASS